MLIWFWMIPLVLHEGFGIDQPYREVNGTTCQEIVIQPNYQTRLPCTGKDERYHCLLNEDYTKEYEVCREWKWIPKDKCAYFNTYGSGNVDERDCKSTPDLSCAVKEYNSDNTQYAACYVKKEMTTVPILEKGIKWYYGTSGGTGVCSTNNQHREMLLPMFSYIFLQHFINQ
ncbi:uncharacterized protein LOC134228402 [Saccostrea cucullata]|uniref:uncharacterized protein LOC134228402 n=1 Tax=Saccostrea cuccullata TaxID=36930 RepID=UPI002ED21177